MPGVAGKVFIESAVARNTASDEKLFSGGEVGDAFRGVRGVSPRPGWKFEYDVVTREDEFFRGDLTSGAERGGVRYWGPSVSKGGECRVEDVHVGSYVKMSFSDLQAEI